MKRYLHRVLRNYVLRKVRRYQGSNQKSLLEGQKMQWPKEKGKKKTYTCRPSTAQNTKNIATRPH